MSFLNKLVLFITDFPQPVEYSSVYWPNSLNLNAVISYLIFSVSLFSAKLCLLPYLCLLLWATYKIGALSFSRRAGIWAAYILFMYPIIFESSRQFQLDFPLTAMVTLTIALLLEANYFQDIRFSLLSGIGLGWSMLIKGQTLFYLAGPLTVIIFGAASRLNTNNHILQKPARTRIITNFFVFIIVSITISSLWWAHHVPEAFCQFIDHLCGHEKIIEMFECSSYLERFSIFMLFYYLRAAPHAMSFLLVSVFIFVVFRNIHSKINSRNFLLLSWFLCPFILYGFCFSMKSSRFLMPILPVIALITAQGIIKIQSSSFKKFLLICLVILTQIQFFGRSFFRFNQHWGLSTAPTRSKSWQKFFPTTSYEITMKKRRIIIPEIIQSIRTLAPDKTSPKVGVIAAADLGGLEILYWLKLYDPTITAFEILHGSEKFYQNLSGMDFIIYTTHYCYGQAPFWPAGDALHQLLKRRLPSKVVFFEQENNPAWKNLIYELTLEEQNFKLVKEFMTGEDGQSCYKLFIRKD
ncbi:MAG: glycosyltransferase family 39 protein [Candidatus Omnitrophota bacterium]